MNCCCWLFDASTVPDPVSSGRNRSPICVWTVRSPHTNVKRRDEIDGAVARRMCASTTITSSYSGLVKIGIDQFRSDMRIVRHGIRFIAQYDVYGGGKCRIFKNTLTIENSTLTFGLVLLKHTDSLFAGITVWRHQNKDIRQNSYTRIINCYINHIWSIFFATQLW
jgi:hypothetical protein